MPRDLTAGMDTAIAATTGEIIHFIEAAFSGGPVRLSTGSVDMPWDAHTWTAVGGDLGVETIGESADLSSGDVECRLSGVDQTILAILLSEKYLGRTVKIWLVHLAGGAIVADPFLIFSGYMNGGWVVREVRPKDGGGTVTIIGRFVSRLARLDQRKGLQTNLASHQAYYAGDQFFAHVNTLRKKPLLWRR